jgi:undecaprenyl-diphosphatase
MSINSATISLAQQIQNPSLTTFSKFITTITDPLVLLSLAIIISIFLYLKNKKSQSFLLSSTSILTALAITVLKNLFKSPRPISNLVLETGYSLPSGHATFAVVFFGLLTYIFTKPKNKTPTIITSILITLIISFTRLYLQVHWLTDILAGLITGIIILTIAIFIHKTSPNTHPSTHQSPSSTH